MSRNFGAGGLPIKCLTLGSEVDQVTVFLYLAVGAGFALAASVSLNRGGLPLLALTTLLTAVALLVVTLLDIGTAAHGEASFGFPLLLAIVPPLVTAGVIHSLGTHRSLKWGQWIAGMLTWIVILIPIGVLALLLDWVTF